MSTLRFTRRAIRDLERAAAWWSDNRPAAPKLLEREVEAALTLLAAQPHLGVPARNAHLVGVRRLYLSGTRYHLYYRHQSSTDAVEVLAFWHSNRGAGPFR